jgi:hypothetical protein
VQNTRACEDGVSLHDGCEDIACEHDTCEDDAWESDSGVIYDRHTTVSLESGGVGIATPPIHVLLVAWNFPATSTHFSGGAPHHH